MIEQTVSLETLWIGAGAVIGALVGLGGGWLSRRKSKHEIQALKAEVARQASQAREQMRIVAKMRSEQGTVASLVRHMPNIVRELNRAEIDPHRIPSLVVHFAAAVFEPEQVLLYLVRSPGHDSGRPKELILRDQRGLDRVPQSLQRIACGHGKIGWVADAKVEMATDDWLNLSRTDGVAVDDHHPAVRLDLIGPLLHHSHDGEHVLGVLGIGRPRIRRGDDKLMLQMVTNLGSMAIMHAYSVGRLREQAHHDGLTGLLNKKQFMKNLGLKINTAEGGARSLGIFIFDIDHFKNYNDSNGHLAGDELLKSMARVLRDNIRPDDVACRYGGEEFVVALPDTDGETALKVAEKIRKAIEAFPFPHGKSQPGGALTISGGVAAFPSDGTNGTELIGHADQALYQAKANGRNRVCRFQAVNIGDAARESDDWDWPPADFVVRT